MEIIFVLLPLSLVIGFVAIIGYFWAVRSGQFDDLETPSLRMLVDEEEGEGSRQKTAPPISRGDSEATESET
ncbi:cbb3-type cytochrome oxidase assembly protein CcoS [bacterium]|nr:cbb3-type cytochrome oxidase assembly protein CcoS [bacterium]